MTKMKRQSVLFIVFLLHNMMQYTIRFDTISNLSKLVQTCSTLFKLVQPCSNLFKTTIWQISIKYLRCDLTQSYQFLSILKLTCKHVLYDFKLVWTCPNLSKTKTWRNSIKYVYMCLNMSKLVQNYNMTKFY
jgi:hypothetical protein